MKVYKVSEELATRVRQARQDQQELEDGRKAVIEELTGIKAEQTGRIPHLLQFYPKREIADRDLPPGLIRDRRGMLKADITSDKGKELNRSYKKQIRRLPRPERLTQIFAAGIDPQINDARVTISLDEIDGDMVVTDFKNINPELAGCEKTEVMLK